MKTATISELLNSELLVVELPRLSNYTLGSRGLFVEDLETKETHVFKGSYTLLGSPDEIKEEDAKPLVDLHLMDGCRSYPLYNDYRYNDSRWLDSAKESLLSAIETEIYWNVNPLGDEPIFTEVSGIKVMNEPKEWERIQAESRTFDRNRSLIFKKN